MNDRQHESPQQGHPAEAKPTCQICGTAVGSWLTMYCFKCRNEIPQNCPKEKK